MNAKTMLTATMLAAALAAGGAAAQGCEFLTTTENVARIQVGKSTSKEVQDLLGKPASVTRNARHGWDQWEYPVLTYGQRSTL